MAKQIAHLTKVATTWGQRRAQRIWHNTPANSKLGVLCIGWRLLNLSQIQLIELGRPNFNIFMKYAKVELTPPSPKEIPQITAELVKLIKDLKGGSWKNYTVREAWLNVLVSIEVACWFYVGECIGKRHIVGYNIKQ